MSNELTKLNEMSATELGKRTFDGSLSVTDLVRSCLSVIEAKEPEICAWAWHNSKFALDQARELDQHRASGSQLGQLHGLPVGIKDVVDTAGIPTENGSPHDKGRVPERNAWIVERLKSEGAVIMGKTVTTELAYLDPSKTKNPRAISHTPGGSSSGSAAAVASGMVPLAIGTQTGGSVIRPAAYCGITGYKPSFGAIPRTGILKHSQSMHTVGVFGQRPEDCWLLAQTLFGHDSGDPSTCVSSRPKLQEKFLTESPVNPRLAFVKPPGWDIASKEIKDTLAKLQELIGIKQKDFMALPQVFDQAEKQRSVVAIAEMAQNFHKYFEDNSNKMGDRIFNALERGSLILAKDYLAAQEWKEILNSELEEIFESTDAIITPSTPTPAPKGLESTGDGIFNGLWTFTGLPTVTIPGFVSDSGLPLGIQLTSARGHDGDLLRTASWLLKKIESI